MSEQLLASIATDEDVLRSIPTSCSRVIAEVVLVVDGLNLNLRLDLAK